MMTEPKTVTIELPSGALGGWRVLIDALEQAKHTTRLELTFGGLIAQIRRQTEPKPYEPTDLGTVIECGDDATRYVLAHPDASKGDGLRWFSSAGGWSDWNSLDVREVLGR
jgi:hypothetical protein